MWLRWIAVNVLAFIMLVVFKVYDFLETWVFSIRFVNDGFFGLDKVGHFVRHAVMTWLAVVLGGSWASIFYQDSMFDLLYEYMNNRTGIGFSPFDVLYGRAGCLSVMWIMGIWQPWIVRMLT